MADHHMRCFSPARLGDLTLRNRLIKAATFEGLTPGGVPGERLRDLHVELARGGVGMTTLAYCAVEPDGRLHEDTMLVHEGIRAELVTLIDAVHAEGCRVAGQMAHGGGFSKNRALVARRPKGPSFGLNRLGAAVGMPFNDAMTEADIRDLIGAYHDAARLMRDVGFDALEIHFGHGYALCQFISPKTNRRKDRYGGSLLNRMRLPLEVLEAVRAAVGDGFPILGKLSLSEGVRGGIPVEEGVEVARLLDEAGIDGIVTSGGTSSMSPMFMMRGQSFLPALIAAEPRRALRVAMRMAGPVMFGEHPFEELYFLEEARRVRAAVRCAVVYVGGASTANSFATLMREGFDFVQLGRALLADPSLPRRAHEERDYASPCTHCNRCVATIEHPRGVHCTEAAGWGEPRP